ncbi:MAG: glycosyltransferase family 39 protein [Lachnospiraceae bacterium]|nr:glycosyltransferase family 39 protein [Lachnospiraceae bacterium]MBR6485400.1 glycosyltransferase family 39 protein [Lachnospiraceae bacterium]
MENLNENNKVPAADKYAGAVITWLLVPLLSAVFISLTYNSNVWLDEAFTASLVRTDMAGVISRSMQDTLPPLYNIILKLTTDAFGYTIPVMKLTSVVPMILTLILGASVVRKRFGAPTACIFMLAVTVMPQMLFFGLEIRMYSLGFLFATASAVFAYEIICKPCKINWCLFTLSSVLAGYSHHFAFVTVGFIYLFLLIYACMGLKKNDENTDKDTPEDLDAEKPDLKQEEHPVKIKDFLICLLATFILYLPCLLVTIKQFLSVSGYFSMPEITMSVFIKYCRYPYTVGLTILSALLITLCGFLLMRTFIRKEKTIHDVYPLYCFAVFYLVLLFGTAISKVMTANIFVDRYLFFSLGLIWFFFAVEAGKLKKIFIYFIILFEITVGIFSYVQAFSSEYAPGSDETIRWLKQNVSPGDSLYTLEEYEELAYCLTFYDPNLKNFETLEGAADAAGDNNIWLAVLEGYDKTDEYNGYMDEIDEKGYSREYVGAFRFDRYMFRMYRLVK